MTKENWLTTSMSGDGSTIVCILNYDRSEWKDSKLVRITDEGVEVLPEPRGEAPNNVAYLSGRHNHFCALSLIPNHPMSQECFA